MSLVLKSNLIIETFRTFTFNVNIDIVKFKSIIFFFFSLLSGINVLCGLMSSALKRYYFIYVACFLVVLGENT